MAFFAVVYRFIDDRDRVSHHRPAHREYLKKFEEHGELVLAGPLGGPEAQGGLLIFKVGEMERVVEILQSDPFLVHKVVDSHSVHDWNPTFGAERLGIHR